MKRTGLVLFMLLIIMGLFALNQMPMINTLTNHIPSSLFGNQLAVLDFNNDGFDDLFVTSFNDTLHQRETIQVYFGGAVLDTIPDLQYSVPFYSTWAGGSILNAGDANGDGYEDFMIREDVEGGYIQSRLIFFYGGTNPDMEPDQIVLY